MTTHDWQDGLQVPASVRTGLERFCTQIQDGLGDALVSIVLYGDLVRGDYAPSTSDVNVMIALREVGVELLDRAAPAVRKAARACRVAVLVLTEEDLRRSTDVFPIKFLDMQRHHRVLFGKDVLSDLPIAHDHLRLRCEQELKNLMLRLRRMYLERGNTPKGIERTLVAAVSALRRDLGVLAELKTGQAPDAGRDLVAVAEQLGLDVEPIRRAQALQRGEQRPDSGELKRIYDGFMQTVQQAAHLADAL